MRDRLTADQIEALYWLAVLIVVMAVAVAIVLDTLHGPPDPPPVPIGRQPNAQHGPSPPEQPLSRPYSEWGPSVRDSKSLRPAANAEASITSLPAAE